MILSLHRSQTIQVLIQKPAQTRAFVFDVQIGLGKPTPAVDPQSGMLLNLVRIDPMLAELGEMWLGQSWMSLIDLLQKSQQYLAARARNEGVLLQEVCLREKRGFWLKWTEQSLLMGRESVLELEGALYKLSWESSIREEDLENSKLSLNSAQDLFTETVFQKNPQLQSLEVENLATREKWSFRKV